MEEGTGGVHVLVIPYPAQGHTLPMLDLAHRLALAGISLTILTTPANLPTLTPLLNSHPSSLLRTLVLPFPPHPSIPPGVENVRHLGNRGNAPVISALSSLRLPILNWFHTHPDPPLAIISDFFLGWTFHVAADLGIPRIAFFSSGAFLGSVSDYCWGNLDSVLASEAVEFTDLPNKPVFKEQHLPSIVRFFQRRDTDWEIFRDGLRMNMLSWGCVFNSFFALEGDYLDHLKRRMGCGRVYAVGPLSLVGVEDASARGSLTGGSNHDDLLGWLDGCTDGSVLYVCFGSQKVLTAEQLEALAGGLERSGVRFVWVVKIGPDLEETSRILDSLEARVGDRGRVVRGWAPQVLVLNHRSVGGFLSHCGWNSAMEAVVAGKMILAWPMEADQYVNARLLVDDMGVAIRVCEGADAVPDPDELGKAIAGSMKDGGPEKVRAGELREKALAAVEPESGSSARDLDRLVEDLGQLPKRNP
ncbi:hypothetical protein MLD38_004362 [Melastoma candidum]|uniref:Uncharacterized protein n=1 Tax=Melastoma candidum TaxID=119954 RepID=A0ACB9S4Y3_9MYRT|nr:hypothetical protein MLD38_004362 [Melastoma candidum]